MRATLALLRRRKPRKGRALSLLLLLWVLIGLQGCPPVVPLPPVTVQDIQQEAVQIPTFTSDEVRVLENIRFGAILVTDNLQAQALARTIVAYWKSQYPAQIRDLLHFVKQFPLDTQESLLETLAIWTLFRQYTGYDLADLADLCPDTPLAGVDPNLVQALCFLLQARVNRMGIAIAQAAGIQATFVLDPSIGMNAAARPEQGRNVVRVGPRLVLLTTDNQLAGVLGHEVAHHVLEHTQPTNARFTIPALTGTLAATFLAAYFTNLNNRRAALGIYPSEWQLRNQAATIEAARGLGHTLGETAVKVSGYTRQQEMEAEALGVRFVQMAGGDPSGVAESLIITEAYNRMRGQRESSSLLDSHPSIAERVARLRKIAPPPFSSTAVSTTPYSTPQPPAVSSPPSHSSRRRIEGGYQYKLK